MVRQIDFLGCINRVTVIGLLVLFVFAAAGCAPSNPRAPVSQPYLPPVSATPTAIGALAYLPPPTIKPTVAAEMTAAEATQRYIPPTPSDPPPLPTARPTPVVTPIPLAQPPFIDLPGEAQVWPFTVLYRDGNTICAVPSTTRQAETLADIGSLSPLFLNIEGSWGAASPDGERLALVLTNFSRPREKGDPWPEYAIYLYDLEIQELRELVADGVEPAWSPDGSRIAYRSTRTSGIWLLDLATGKSQEIYPSAPEHYVTDIAWLPDSRRLAFTDLVIHESSKIRVIDIDGNVSDLTPGSQAQASPDGTQTSYVSTEGHSTIGDRFANLWIISPDGSDKKQLTVDIDLCSAPRFSLNGKWIAFTGVKFYETQLFDCDLWVMNVEGQELLRLTTGAVNENHVTWSPDGAHLVFSRELGELWQISLRDGQETRLATAADPIRELIILPGILGQE